MYGYYLSYRIVDEGNGPKTKTAQRSGKSRANDRRYKNVHTYQPNLGLRFEVLNQYIVTFDMGSLWPTPSRIAVALLNKGIPSGGFLYIRDRRSINIQKCSNGISVWLPHTLSKIRFTSAFVGDKPKSSSAA